MTPDFILGVDLGQTTDYTALCVLEATPVDTGRRVTVREVGTTVVQGSVDAWDDALADDDPRAPDPFTKVLPVYEHHYAARHLERLPIGTPYPAQVERIKALHDRLNKATGTPPLLVVDQTGVGRPVTDMLRGTGLHPVPVTITGGDAVHTTADGLRVPKRDLVAAVQVLLQGERLKIAKALPEASTLTAELLAFKVSISLKGHDSYGNDVGPWRENPHDDLVLATALACWYGEVRMKRLQP